MGPSHRRQPVHDVATVGGRYTGPPGVALMMVLRRLKRIGTALNWNFVPTGMPAEFFSVSVYVPFVVDVSAAKSAAELALQRRDEIHHELVEHAAWNADVVMGSRHVLAHLRLGVDVSGHLDRARVGVRTAEERFELQRETGFKPCWRVMGCTAVGGITCYSRKIGRFDRVRQKACDSRIDHAGHYAGGRRITAERGPDGQILRMLRCHGRNVVSASASAERERRRCGNDDTDEKLHELSPLNAIATPFPEVGRQAPWLDDICRYGGRARTDAVAIEDANGCRRPRHSLDRGSVRDEVLIAHPLRGSTRISDCFQSTAAIFRRTKMKSCSKVKLGGAALALAFATCVYAPATEAGSMSMEQTVEVGGAAMYPSRNIVENAVNSHDHTTLVAAVKAGGLVDTLSSKGPFTVFAPTNDAFAALPAGTVQTLLKPENKAMLVKVLTYHVVSGRLTAFDLARAVEQGGGKATLKTVEGDSLIVSRGANGLAVTDDKGNVAHVTIGDVMQSNGVIHVVDSVLMP